MNEVFLIGTVMNQVEFKFIINSKHKKSVARFTLKTENEQEIKVKAYNEMADFVYKYLKTNNKIMIYGRLDKRCEIVVEEVEFF